MDRHRLRRRVGALAVAGVILVGCGDGNDTQAPAAQDPGSRSDVGETSEPSGTAPGTFADLLPRIVMDYDPTAGPTELADMVDIVVVGRLRGFSAGGVLGLPDDDPMHHVRTAVMEIAVDEVAKGQLVEADGGVLHLEVGLMRIDGHDVTFEDLDRVTPKGARVVAYASVKRTPPGDPDSPLVDWPGTARGKILYRLGTPESFYIATDEGIFRPWGTASGRAPLPHGERVTGPEPIELADLLPPAQTWPYDRP